jgi:hypothetical protein
MRRQHQRWPSVSASIGLFNEASMAIEMYRQIIFEPPSIIFFATRSSTWPGHHTDENPTRSGGRFHKTVTAFIMEQLIMLRQKEGCGQL